MRAVPCADFYRVKLIFRKHLSVIGVILFETVFFCKFFRSLLVEVAACNKFYAIAHPFVNVTVNVGDASCADKSEFN